MKQELAHHAPPHHARFSAEIRFPFPYTFFFFSQTYRYIRIAMVYLFKVNNYMQNLYQR